MSARIEIEMREFVKTRSCYMHDPRLCGAGAFYHHKIHQNEQTSTRPRCTRTPHIPHAPNPGGSLKLKAQSPSAQGSRPELLRKPKEPPTALLRLLVLPRLMLHLLLRDMPAERIPRDGRHAQRRGEHAREHRPNAARVPAVVLRERPGGEPGEVRRGRVPRGVARRRDAERGALVVHELRDRVVLLRD